MVIRSIEITIGEFYLSVKIAFILAQLAIILSNWVVRTCHWLTETDRLTYLDK